MSKIGVNDTGMEAMIKVSEGNPGALAAIMSIGTAYPNVDPDSWGCIGPTGVALLLDDVEIYGSDVHILFKDVCESNPINSIALFRAVQLGLVPRTEMLTVGRNFPELIEKIRGKGITFNT